MSTAHNSANIEDVAKVVLMPGDPLRAKLIAENFLRMPYYLMMYEACQDIQGLIKEKEFLSWEAEWEWQVWESIPMNFFKFYDVDAIIRVGSTGSYSERLPMKSVALVKGSYSESTMPQHKVAIRIVCNIQMKI